MAQGQGNAVELRIGFEDTFGTTPGTPATFKVPFAPNLEISEKQSQKESAVLTGSRNPQKPFLGYKTVDGSVKVPVDTIAFGYWLKAVFGDPSTTGTGPYTHVYTVGSSVPSLYAEKAHTDLTLFYLANGIKANELSLSFGGDGELLADITLMGQKVTKGTSEVATSTDKTSGDPFGSFQVSMTGATNVKEISFKYTNNLDGDQYTLDDGAERGDIPEGMVGVSGSITLLFEDDTMRAAAAAQTEQTLTITVDNGTESIVFAMPEVVLEPTGSPAVDGPTGLTQSFNYTAYYQNDAAGSAMKATLVNSQATY